MAASMHAFYGPRNEKKFLLALLKPSRAANVTLSRRKEFRMVKWVLKA